MHLYISGFGFSLVTVPTHVAVSLWFDKYRSTATSLILCGGGLGSAVFQVIVDRLTNAYGWRGSLLLVGGISLHNFVFAMLISVPDSKSGSDDVCLKNITNSKHELYSDTEYTISETTNLNVNTSDNDDKYTSIETDIIPSPSNHSNNIVQNETQTTTTTTTTNSCFGCKEFFSLGFILWLLNNLIWNMGSSVIPVLGPEYFTSGGFERSMAAILMVLYNVSIGVGSIFAGVMGNISCIDRTWLSIGATVLKGLLTFLFPVKQLQTLVGICCIVISFGFTFGMILGLIVVITTDIVGLHHLSDAYGVVLFLNGIGCVIGPPLGGKYNILDLRIICINPGMNTQYTVWFQYTV